MAQNGNLLHVGVFSSSLAGWRLQQCGEHTVLAYYPESLSAVLLVSHRTCSYGGITLCAVHLHSGYLPSFWIKLRNISMPGPDLQLPVSVEQWPA